MSVTRPWAAVLLEANRCWKIEELSLDLTPEKINDPTHWL
jgi:hypothetical protein